MTVDIVPALNDSRYRAAQWLLRVCLVFGVMIMGVGLLLPVNSAWPGAIALAVTGLGYWSFKARHAQYCIIAGQAAVAQAIALTAALSGTGWQIDAHMMFYVALAALVGLVDVRTILLAAATIVAHHLILGIVFPALVFPSVDLIENVERALFHGGIVGLEVLALSWAVTIRLGLTAQVHAALLQADEAIEEAKAAGQMAEGARAEAEAEAARAHAAQTQAEELVGVLETEQAAREQANQAARLAEERSATVQKDAMEAQAQVVSALRDGLAQIAKGDLSNPISDPFPEAYEPLRLDYNRAITDLASVLSEVLARTGQLMEQVAAVSGAANDLAGRTDKQVASLEATSVAIETLRKVVQASTENAGTTASSAAEVKADAMAGGEVVREVVVAMSEIEASSQEIAKINAVMDSIAFQTNLLALNAGVEAARAGEAGRGFSVVASEVRALSRRATEAARGINELTERSGRQVQAGVSLVGTAGEALDGIVSSIARMTETVACIADAANEQSDGLSAVNRTVSELDAVAQSNAAMFEETSTACLSLTAGREQIAGRLRQFRVGHRAGQPVDDAEDWAMDDAPTSAAS